MVTPMVRRNMTMMLTSPRTAAIAGGSTSSFPSRSPISPQVQRIAKIELLRRRQQGTGTFVLNMVGYQLIAFDVIGLTLAYFGWLGKLLEIRGHRLKFDQNGEEAVLVGTEIDVAGNRPFRLRVVGNRGIRRRRGYQQAITPAATRPANVTGLICDFDRPAGRQWADVQAVGPVSWTAPADGFVNQIEVQFQLASSPPWPMERRTERPSLGDAGLHYRRRRRPAIQREVQTVNVAGALSGWIGSRSGYGRLPDRSVVCGQREIQRKLRRCRRSI